MTPKECRDRERIGLTNMMWGADFPHVEGTWPHSRSWLSRAMIDVPDEERRLILGENASRAYKIDLEKLQPDVDRIGLRADDISRENAKGWDQLIYSG